MDRHERFSSAHIEKGERLAKIAPGYLDLYPNMPHQAARSEVNPKMVKMAQSELGWQTLERQHVPDEMVRWQVEMPGYDPTVLDLPRGATRFRKQGDAPHDADPSKIAHFKSLEVTEVARDEYGFPRNPIGRTGIRGRGMLDKWGPTEAADPVVTRHHPETGLLEVLLIQRGDTGQWAFPGGKVDEGETAAIAAGRELIEEAGVSGIELHFSDAAIVYAGYIDDSRNTDNAWLEATALHLHLDEYEAVAVTIEAGSDANAVRWATVDAALLRTMLKAHADILSLALGERP